MGAWIPLCMLHNYDGSQVNCMGFLEPPDGLGDAQNGWNGWIDGCRGDC